MCIYDVKNFCLSHVLTKEDILLKFWETKKKYTVHVGLVHWILYFYIKSCFYTIFYQVLIKDRWRLYVTFFDDCKMSMKHCFKTAFLLKIQTSMDQADLH